jgi:hypothetical protein
MKRSISIVMLIIFLLNTVGYYGFFIGVLASQQNLISQELDQDEFVGSDAITFRIPLSIPYHTDVNEYERVQGKFEKDGEVFQLVKQKMLNDTLYVVCVKDGESKKINQALTDYVKTFSDGHDNSKHSGSKKIISPISEYTLTSIDLKTLHSGWIKSLEFNEFKSIQAILVSVAITSPPRLYSLS